MKYALTIMLIGEEPSDANDLNFFLGEITKRETLDATLLKWFLKNMSPSKRKKIDKFLRKNNIEINTKTAVFSTDEERDQTFQIIKYITENVGSESEWNRVNILFYELD